MAICIEVPQVLDFCFQTDTQDVCIPVDEFRKKDGRPDDLDPEDGWKHKKCELEGEGPFTATCALVHVQCQEVSRTESATSGFYDVTFLVSFTTKISILDENGNVICFGKFKSSFFKTVTLCAPDGATTVCEVTTGCGPCIVVDDVVCCTLNLCLVFKSVYPVVLSVEGTVLTPGVCVTPSPFPPICPPTAPTVCVNCPPSSSI